MKGLNFKLEQQLDASRIEVGKNGCLVGSSLFYNNKGLTEAPAQSAERQYYFYT